MSLHRGITRDKYTPSFGDLWLPALTDPDITDKLRATWHWSAGHYKIGDPALKHYNFCIASDGEVMEGVPIELQLNTNAYPRHEGYAKHVRNANSNNIAISVMGMFDAHESKARQGNYGSAPITKAQIDSLVELTAYLCFAYNIPTIPTRILGHVEWRSVMGIHQDRWDVACIPHLDIRPQELDDGTWTAHNYLRERIATELAELNVLAIAADTIDMSTMDKINGHLGELYEGVKLLPVSDFVGWQLTKRLNQFNEALIRAGLKK